MAEKKTDPNKPSHAQRDLWLGVTPSEWIISGIAGVTSGVVAGAAKIRSSFYEEIKEWPFIRDLYAEHARNLDRINTTYANKPEQWQQHTKELNKVKEEFGLNIDRTIHKTWGITPRSEKWLSLDIFKDLTYGTYQRSKAAGANTANKIVFNAVVGMVIGSAATLSFFNGVASRHKIERIEDAVNNETLKHHNR